MITNNKMKATLLIGLLCLCIHSGKAQTFKEWQDPEINAVNRAPMHTNFFKRKIRQLNDFKRYLEISLCKRLGRSSD